ncbi:Flagellar motor switch protein FliN [Buchnera aphidicola (Takecallis arundicolens)]|uniref:FliM/FliN family flagellar motor switch protein n=1 Tax=Buchnera aphidicola TaxID=9 RepID=UPI003463EA08
MNKDIKDIKHDFNHDIHELETSKNKLLNVDKKNKKISNLNILNIKNSILSEAVLDVMIQLGVMKIKIQDLLQIIPGTILYLNKLNYDILDIFINDVLIAQGELVKLKDRYGIRVIKIFKSRH